MNIPSTKRLHKYGLSILEEEQHYRTRARQGSLSLDYLVYLEGSE